MIKEKTCCFTGHRIIPPQDYDIVKSNLKKILISLIKQGVIYFGAGGARGFDTLAELTVIELMGDYDNIRLILVLPCRDHTRLWNEKDKESFEYIRSKSSKTVYTCESYLPGCMHIRNRHLVNNSSICVCYMTQNTGGTGYTVNYASEQGLKIINTAYDDTI